MKPASGIIKKPDPESDLQLCSQYFEIYELSHKLTNDSKLRILGNIRKISKLDGNIA